jgi:hypothetical protein
MKFIAYVKRCAAKGKKTKKKQTVRYYTPAFIVSGSHNNKLFSKSFNIKTMGYDIAWFKAVDFLCTTKGIYSTDDLQRRKPPVEQFAIVYKWQSGQGHDIPMERLPDEFLKRDVNGDLSRYINS